LDFGDLTLLGVVFWAAVLALVLGVEL